MIIRSAQFAISCEKTAEFPDDSLPQIAFSGRSNVGKSSLINILVQINRLAFTSRTPGRTQRLNFFLINGAFYFVDLPGYGYAKVPAETHKKWQPMIESYLESATQLRGVIPLLDARHDPSDLDLQMLRYLAGQAIPFRVVATKIDKLSRNERARKLAALNQITAPWMNEKAIAFSAVTREGREPLLEAIETMLVAEAPERLDAAE
ncbi:MAG: ribosome biogenesis GTP-binding protein YihA/YsxC [Candidatus Sumerlaeota bacterium]|nr:ribosome biogenesis GTP-binding protein YihA/YsxC [Candidatus Sumerlaeota bacterium]